MPKIYRIRLEVSERRSLEAILRKKKCAAHRQRRARILLKADENSPRGSLTDIESDSLPGYIDGSLSLFIAVAKYEI